MRDSPSDIPGTSRRRPWLAAIIPILAAILTGSALGAATFTFEYGQGTSYLSAASETCANCHVMQDHFDAWAKSTHHHVAQCNDCHAPHDFVGKWYCKGRNGLLHSLAFTTQDFHEPILIKPYNRQVVEANCRYCHGEFTHGIDRGVGAAVLEPLDCIRCHAGVGHPN